MSDEIRVNRPAPVAQGAVGVQAATPVAQTSKMPWIILGVIVVVLLVVGVLFRDKLFGGATQDATKTTTAKASAYNAVFLTNGQVYFGKMSKNKDGYVALTDIYYLQVLQQPGLQGSGQTEQEQQAQSQISLVKLGNELHGPVDEMFISESQILFYEVMKEDSQVVQAIKNYITNPEGTAPATQQPAPAPAPVPVQ